MIDEGRLAPPSSPPDRFHSLATLPPRCPSVPTSPTLGTDLDHLALTPNGEKGWAPGSPIEDLAVASSDPIPNRIRTLHSNEGSPRGGKEGEQKLKVTGENGIRGMHLKRPPDVP